MPSFEYVAIGPTGKTLKGSIDADNVRVARQRLRAQGVFPTDIKEGMASAREGGSTRDIKKYFQSDRVSTRELSITTRQLATLVGAGLPLVGALQALAEQCEGVTLKRILIEIRESVEEGSALAKAMGSFPKAFPRLYVNMVASGEASGTLDSVLTNLADYLEAQVELRRKITSSLFYPILMFCFCTLVVTLLLAFVVPSIVDIFQRQNAKLPLPTRVMLGISHLVTGYWWLVLALVLAGIYGLRAYYRTPDGRSKVDFILLKLPIYGSIYRKIGTARVSRTLGTLLGSGVGLLAALDIVKNIVGNVHLSNSLVEAAEGVREGRSLAKELARSNMYPHLLCHMIAVGEQSGRLEEMLTQAGRAYENEVNATLSGLTSLIEPIMIIVLGGAVFSIVISILMPMMDLINIVQR